MDNLKSIRLFLLAGLLVFTSLACALTNAYDRFQQGQQAIETVQGVVTALDQNSIKETAWALATNASMGGIRQTAQAMATDIVVEPGDVPADIPIMPGEKFAFVGSDQVISYSVSAGFAEVLAFYESGMEAHGWQVVQLGTVIGEASADLYYQKPERKVQVVINRVPFVDQVSVVISMQ